VVVRVVELLLELGDFFCLRADQLVFCDHLSCKCCRRFFGRGTNSLRRLFQLLARLASFIECFVFLDQVSL
jgi:hypothetical protein